MKHRSFSTCLLVTALLTTTAFAQEQTAKTEAAATAPPTEATGPATETAENTATDSAAATTDASAPAVAETATAPAAPTTALSEKVTAAIGTPGPGKALVVFFRPGKFVGAAVGFKVRENDVELGKLRNGNYFAIEVEPGQHSYVVHSETKDVTTIEAEAGETYFLSGSISMGIMAGRPNLAPSDAAAFEDVLPKLKKSKPLD
jgi:hypothetical protein